MSCYPEDLVTRRNHRRLPSKQCTQIPRSAIGSMAGTLVVTSWRLRGQVCAGLGCGGAWPLPPTYRDITELRGAFGLAETLEGVCILLYKVWAKYWRYLRQGGYVRTLWLSCWAACLIPREPHLSAASRCQKHSNLISVNKCQWQRQIKK